SRRHSPKKPFCARATPSSARKHSSRERRQSESYDDEHGSIRSSDWTRSPHSSPDPLENLLRMLDDLWRGPERERLSDLHGDAGRAARTQSPRGRTGYSNRTRRALYYRAILYFRSKELFLSR